MLIETPYQQQVDELTQRLEALNAEYLALVDAPPAPRQPTAIERVITLMGEAQALLTERGALHQVSERLALFADQVANEERVLVRAGRISRLRSDAERLLKEIKRAETSATWSAAAGTSGKAREHLVTLGVPAPILDRVADHAKSTALTEMEQAAPKREPAAEVVGG